MAWLDRRGLVRSVIAALLLLLAACSGVPRQEAVRDGAPPEHGDIASVPDAVPRDEPPSRGGNASPYTVLGRTYRVLSTADGYRAEGIASWYGSKFHGRRTANGEIYDAYAMTAAHRTLPIPTYVRVTNLENGRKVIVRVNDRGPFHDDRIIDLSYAAAYKLGFHRAGTARVELEALSEASTVPALASPEPDKSPDPGGGTLLQAGAFRSLSGAERLRQALSYLLDETVFIDRLDQGEAPWYRVRIGPINQPERVPHLQRQVSEARFDTPVVVK